MVDEIEAILKHSGVGAGLTEALKDNLCRSVAIDLNNYFQDKLLNGIQLDWYSKGWDDAARNIFEEIDGWEGVWLIADGELDEKEWQEFKARYLEKGEQDG